MFKSTSGRSILFSELPGSILRCQPAVQRMVFPKVGQGAECHLGWGHGKRSARKLILSLGLWWNMSTLGSWHFVFMLRNSLVGYFRSVHKCYKAGRQAGILVQQWHHEYYIARGGRYGNTFLGPHVPAGSGSVLCQKLRLTGSPVLAHVANNCSTNHLKTDSSSLCKLIKIWAGVKRIGYLLFLTYRNIFFLHFAT